MTVQSERFNDFTNEAGDAMEASGLTLSAIQVVRLRKVIAQIADDNGLLLVHVSEVGL